MDIGIPISGKMKITALIGSPISHSLSPALHNTSFIHTKTDAVFVALEVQPDSLETVVSALCASGVSGYSVTMPLKQRICPYLDELSLTAKLMGAVNTVVVRNGRSIGHNTDGAGFVSNCRSCGFDPKGKTITIVGTGGAGSAIFTQLALEKAQKIYVFSHREEFLIRQNIQKLSEKTGVPMEIHVLDDQECLASCISESDLFINATCVGMPPLEDECVIDKTMLHNGLAVADTVYEPQTTKLISMAQKQGLLVIPGVGMLLHQAALSEKIWLDIDMPIKIIKDRFFPERPTI